MCVFSILSYGGQFAEGAEPSESVSVTENDRSSEEVRESKQSGARVEI